jgi:uncharacterized OB-fold protein
MSDSVADRQNRPGGMPAPVVTPVNEGMWRAAADNQLAVQACSECGAHRYPPADGCYRCGSLRWEWSKLPGTGVVYSFIWVPDRRRAEESGEAAHYNVAVVALDGTEGEPVRVLSNVVNAWQLDDLQVGQRVEVVGVPFGEGLALPCFKVVA